MKSSLRAALPWVVIVLVALGATVLRYGFIEPADAAHAIATARAAALADDAGKALDATLVQHGAPPRAVKEVPIQWMRKPTTRTSGAAK